MSALDTPEHFNAFSDDGIALVHANCKEVLKEVRESSVALVIIDPPYGGHTHNQQAWDVAWSDGEWVDILREIFRVLIPGGHMIVFSSGKSTIDINTSIIAGYKTLFMKKPSYYPMVWVHNSQDSGRVHQHIPRSQFESMHVYYREGEGKLMQEAGTFSKAYAYDQHVGRHNVFHFYKDDCAKKPYPTVQAFFEEARLRGKHLSTFDYKPEALIRALIRDYSKPNQTVADICMRHGITAVACKIEKRKCIGIETDEFAYKNAVNRFKEQFDSSPRLDCGPELNCITPEPTSKTRKLISARLEAKEVPHYPRPRGRAPNGSAWCVDTGVWVPKPSYSVADGTPAPAAKRRNTEQPPSRVVAAIAKHSTSTKRACSGPGCDLLDGHLGLCSCEPIQAKRRRSSLL